MDAAKRIFLFLFPGPYVPNTKVVLTLYSIDIYSHSYLEFHVKTTVCFFTKTPAYIDFLSFRFF